MAFKDVIAKETSSKHLNENVPKLRFPDFAGEWKTIAFSDLFDVLPNNTLSRAELSDNGEIKNIHYGDVLIKYGDTLDLSSNIIPFISTKSSVRRSDVYLRNGDVIIADTAEDETVGKAVEVFNSDNIKSVSGLHTIPCRPKMSFALKFLGYSINSYNFHKQLITLMQGIKVLSISKSNIAKTIIYYPEYKEQQKISAFLTLLDERIDKQRQLVENIKTYKRGALSVMFPQKGETVPKCRFSSFTGAWEKRKLGELGEIITGSTPSTSHEEYYSADGIPWVTPTDITENTIYDTQKKLSVEGQKVGRVVPKSTILVTCIASIGKNAILGTTGSFNQQINGLVPDFDKFVPYFLFTESMLWSEKMKKQAAAGTMQIVNKTEFSELETRVPDFQEQEKIGSFFSGLDSLITLHQRKLDMLMKTKQSMLQQMFI